MNKSFMHYLLHPTRLLVRLDQKGILRLNDCTYLRWLFKQRVGYKLDLCNPRSFNEKIQWLKLNDRKDIYTDFVDKYEVKKKAATIIGDEYIVPTLGVWNSFDEIDFDRLPSRFVLKTTHDSGGLVIVNDKQKLDKDEAKVKLECSLSRDYFLSGREWPYKNVKRRIIAEKFLDIGGNEELSDYKLMVFNGKVKCSFTCTERFSGEGLKVTFFDENWNVMPFERHYPKSKQSIKKPENYDLMVQLSEKLAEGIRFVRVDFYEVKGKVYFGEMTFYPGSGMEEFRPEEWDFRMGEWIDLAPK